ncbi:MAG: hypothetical protein K5886_09410 [Lachnospiraceae bacterium]|nr:hypothetical protein [Lachnospiraceae bacterium]
MTKKRFGIYLCLFLIFGLFNTGYFALYRTAFILKDGVVSDYYLGALLGLLYGRLPVIAPDLVYDILILALIFAAGLVFLCLLLRSDINVSISFALTFFCAFSGFTVIIGLAHPDILILMIFVPAAVMLFRSRKYPAGAIVSLICLIFTVNVLRGGALTSLLSWLKGMDLRELIYIFMPVPLIIALTVTKKKNMVEEKVFSVLLMLIVFYSDLITNFFEFSIFEGNGVNSLYVNSGTIYGSLTSLADIVFKGAKL